MTAPPNAPDSVSESEWQARAQLAAVVKSSHDAIVSRNLDGMITSWNPGAVRLYGYSPSEVIGNDKFLLAHPDFRSAEASLLARTAKGEHIEMFRSRRVHKNGSLLEVSLSLSPIVDDANVIIGTVSASRDMSDLAWAHPRSQMLLDTTPDAMICVDAEGTITLLNDQVEKLFGYTKAELVGHSIEMLGQSTAQAFSPALQRDYVLKPTIAGIDGPAQLIGQRKDGTTFPADINLGAVDLGGNLVVTAAIRDVTARIAVQLALQESEFLFRQLAESVNVAFLLRRLDPPEFLYVSPGYERIFGYNPLAAHETPTASVDHVHPDDRALFDEVYWSAAEAGSTAQLEYRIIRPDGQVRWVRAVTTPVAEVSGGAVHCASTVEDITERIHTEAALRAAADAEKASAAKNEFLSRMSHELRTPLNAVLGFGQLLELSTLTDQQRHAVKFILDGGRHLVELIDDVLDVAKIESGHLSMSLEPILIGDLLTDTVDLMQPMASSSNVRLYYDGIGTDTVYVLGDIRRLRQVVLNLLSNAIKYNQPDGRVDVRCEKTDDGSVDITVRDTGVGIPVEDIPRLFTPFERLGARDSGIEGSGVGLALSHRLLKAMGGSLSAHSQLGVGTTFTARIALVSDQGELKRPDIQAPYQEKSRVLSLSPRTVLCIEDNRSNVQLMEQLIGLRPQWQLIVAGHGDLGLKLAAANHPDLVLLDLHLPHMGGAEVLRRLRADIKTRDLPVVIVSADANPQQTSTLLAAGANAYLTKPLDVTKVLTLLDAYSKDTRSAA